MSRTHIHARENPVERDRPEQCDKSLIHENDMRNLRRLTNSLFVSEVNVAIAAWAFLCLVFPRFTIWGGRLCLLVLLLLVYDIILVLRDLFRSGTRGRAVFAIVLWLPVMFLLGMIPQWEGPLYVAVKGDPPTFEARGMAQFCGLEIYSPEHDKAEWQGDHIGLVWKFGNNPGHFPEAQRFAYGQVPSGFFQTTPAANLPPPPLDPALTYTLVVNRCMGGPQYLSLRGLALTPYKPNPDVCWGELKVPERQNPAWVRVDCKTHQPLPMSDRAKQRLEAYRENRVTFF
jgi:hypothetical protein